MAEKFTESAFDDETEWFDVGEYENGETDKSVFIKENFHNGKCLWGIYDADGNRLAVTDNRDCAFVVARQNDFIPYSVH